MTCQTAVPNQGYLKHCTEGKGTNTSEAYCQDPKPYLTHIYNTTLSKGTHNRPSPSYQLNYNNKNEYNNKIIPQDPSKNMHTVLGCGNNLTCLSI
jgi:hypothetical protein